ncbi:hypothetical protein DTO271G3_5006 [Paecilomyces variotii]|nr:hypothetical protein DTO271G3_5006 [Paecilomyces variotii]
MGEVVWGELGERGLSEERRESTRVVVEEREGGRWPGPGAEQSSETSDQTSVSTGGGGKAAARQGQQTLEQYARVTGQPLLVSYRTRHVLSPGGVAAASCSTLGCAEVWVRPDRLLCVVRVSVRRWVQHGSDGGQTKAEHHSRRQ